MDSDLESHRRWQGYSVSSNERSAPSTSSSQQDHLRYHHAPSSGFFSNSHQMHVSGGTYNYIHQINNPNIGSLQLMKFAVSAAMHTSGEAFDRPGCCEDTRVAVLKRLWDWVLEAQAGIMWLYGDAGAGKSAIAQSLAVQSHEAKHLIASFFFSRNDSRRSTQASFIATLVYQAVKAIPALKPLIYSVIDEDPMIFEQTLEVQLESLLVEPLNELFGPSGIANHTIPRLIIVDGLDECSTPKAQCHILKVVLQAIQRCNLPLKILISCRPEIEIKSAFNSNPLAGLSTRVALDNTFQPEEDIKTFLKRVFTEIKEMHPFKRYIPESWPTIDVLSELARRSSGQFIYASTIAKHISSPRHRPVDRLEKVLGVRPLLCDSDLPYADVDAMYRHLFSNIPEEKLGKVTKILGLILVVQPAVGPHGVVDLQEVKWLSHFLSLEQGHVEFYLVDLSSVLRWDQTSTDPRVHVTHASLSDFLLDHGRSKEFHIKSGLVFADVASLALREMKQTTESIIARYGFAKISKLLRRATPILELQSHINEFSLAHAANFFSATKQFRLSKPRLFFTFAMEFISIIKEIPDFAGLHSQHQADFDMYLRLFLKKYSHTDLLLVTTLLGLKQPELTPEGPSGIGSRDIVTSSRDSEKPLRRIFFTQEWPEPQSTKAGEQSPAEHMLLRWQPVFDFELLNEWCTRDIASTPEVAMLVGFFKNADRATELVVNELQYAKAAIRCFKYILEHSAAQYDTGNLRPHHQGNDTEMSTVIAFAYLPQLIGRSCSHPELLELIRSRGLEWMYKRSSDVPLAGRLSNRSEDLVPDVLNASLDYYARYQAMNPVQESPSASLPSWAQAELQEVAKAAMDESVREFKSLVKKLQALAWETSVHRRPRNRYLTTDVSMNRDEVNFIQKTARHHTRITDLQRVMDNMHTNCFGPYNRRAVGRKKWRKVRRLVDKIVFSDSRFRFNIICLEFEVNG